MRDDLKKLIGLDCLVLTSVVRSVKVKTLSQGMQLGQYK